VQDFIAADILASQLVFITSEGPTVPTRALILLPGYPLLNGYPDARVPVDSPSHKLCRNGSNGGDAMWNAKSGVSREHVLHGDIDVPQERALWGVWPTEKHYKAWDLGMG